MLKNISAGSFSAFDRNLNREFFLNITDKYFIGPKLINFISEPY